MLLLFHHFCIDVLTTSFTGVKPFPIPPSNNYSIIEIANLYPYPQPQTTYINHLYVYPLSLSFDSQKNFPRARNITCMVQLFDCDDENSKPIKVILLLLPCLQLYININICLKYSVYMD